MVEGRAGVHNATKSDLINDLARAWSPFAAHHANIRNYFTASWDNSSFSTSLGHTFSTFIMALFPLHYTRPLRIKYSVQWLGLNFARCTYNQRSTPTYAFILRGAFQRDFKAVFLTVKGRILCVG